MSPDGENRILKVLSAQIAAKQAEDLRRDEWEGNVTAALADIKRDILKIPRATGHIVQRIHDEEWSGVHDLPPRDMTGPVRTHQVEVVRAELTRGDDSQKIRLQQVTTTDETQSVGVQYFGRIGWPLMVKVAKHWAAPLLLVLSNVLWAIWHHSHR